MCPVYSAGHYFFINISVVLYFGLFFYYTCLMRTDNDNLKYAENSMKRLLLYSTMVLTFLVFISCSNDGIDKEMYAERVKSEFLHAWNGYVKFAWGHDDLTPLSQSYKDWHPETLYMTPVDALDTMLIMGFKDEAEKAKELILENLSFDHDFYVQNFEIVIRILGGLITAYQMDGDTRFLELADDLSKRLMPVFNSVTGMPYRDVNLRTGAVRGEVNNPAEIGTLILEFGTVSKLSGKPEYFDKAKNAILELFNRRSEIGLVGTTINVNTGEWDNKRSHISGMIDSYYEYLLKGSLLFDDTEFGTMWKVSAEAVNTYLYDETDNGVWYGHCDMVTGNITGTRFGALDAFFPAVLALSGDLDRAEKLQDSCYRMWMQFDIEPEQLDYSTMEEINPMYILRPENIESAYYLYRYTKDEKYLKMGIDYFESIVKYCRTEDAYASLSNVVTKEKSDSMQSFFLAETLKYLYLLFAPEETIDFENVIFNTEAHPIRKTW